MALPTGLYQAIGANALADAKQRQIQTKQASLANQGMALGQIAQSQKFVPRAMEATFIPDKQEFNVMNFIKDLSAGGISGAVAKTATAPIERIKLLMQTQDANPRIMSGEVERYTGIVNCATRVAAEQGMMSFWRGNLTNVIRYFPTQAFNFAFKDTIKSLFPSYDPKTEVAKSFLTNILSGGAAGAASLLIVYPLDFARTRLASDVGKGQREFSGLADCIGKTVKRSGFFSLYQGFGPSVYGIIVYRGAYFGLYDTAKGALLSSDSSFIAKFVVAQTVTTSAGIIAYPFDTIRRRLQMQSGSSHTLYSGVLNAFTRISSEEGLGALFKGAFSNVLRGVGGALVLVLYDEVKALVNPEAAKAQDPTK